MPYWYVKRSHERGSLSDVFFTTADFYLMSLSWICKMELASAHARGIVRLTGTKHDQSQLSNLQCMQISHRIDA